MSVFTGPEIRNLDLSVLVDAENPRGWSYNVHPYAKNIGGWTLSGTNCTLTRDLTFTTTTESPVAGVPLKMVVTGTDPYINPPVAHLAPASVGQTWTVSAYAKANTSVSGCELFVVGLNSANSYIEVPSGYINITTEWQRFSYTYTFANALTTGITCRLDGPNAGTASIIWWDGLQVEKNSAATAFNPNQNVDGNRVYGIAAPTVATHTLAGATTHNNTSPKSFNTNATTITEGNYIDLGTTYTFPDASEYTFEFVVKLRSSAQSTYHSLAGYGSANPWLSVYTNDTTGDSWYLRYRNAASTYHDFSVVTNHNIQQNWAHITLTVDGSRTCKFYLNGILNSSLSTATSLFYVNRIAGGYLSAPNHYALQGSLALCKLYTVALSATEVKSNFAATRARFNI